MDKRAEDGSTQRHDGSLIGETAGSPPNPAAAADERTVTYRATSNELPGLMSGASPLPDADNSANTVISNRPVAAPEEFYRSMPLAELAEMLEGRQLDHFSVEQMIGGGGMGAVFRGRDIRLDRVVAIKVIPASKRDAETLRRFRLEAQSAARLDHPNIARVFYVGEAERWNYIVFEFIDGVNMRDLVEMEGPLSIDDAIYYTRQVAEALEHAHSRDVVHRDVKPSNILVTSVGQAKVVDMGLARDTSMERSTGDETASGITLGTFDYISPEQARDPRDADVRSDLYSLGCSLFYMLTGSPPFPEGTALQKLLNHGSVPPPDIRLWRDDVSDQLHDILMKLMAKRPSDRYQRPVELINDLQLLAEYEELPRSQSPSTYMVTAAASQRSILETNLPWMVALAFLLGSTLWLESMQGLSSQIRLPKIEPVVNRAVDAADKDLRPASGSAGDRTLGGGPASPNNSVPTDQPVIDSAAAQRIVVSRLPPTDVAANRWQATLGSAIEQAAELELASIEIRGEVALDRPVVLSGRNLQLVGQRGTGARVVVSPASLGGGQRAAIRLREAGLQVNDLAIELSGSSPATMTTPVDARGIFQLETPSCSLRLSNCELTVDALSTAEVTSVVVSNQQRAPLSIGAAVSGAAASAVPGLRQPIDVGLGAVGQGIWNALSPTDVTQEIRVVDCEVRGDGRLIRYIDADPASQLDVTMEGSLVAMSEGVLRVESRNGNARPKSLQLNAKGCTFISRQPFCSIFYSGDGLPQLQLRRLSENCVYLNEIGGHFALHGASRTSLFGTFVLLRLEGEGNIYSESTADELCEAFSGSTTSATFGFAEASVDGWFAEKSNEYQVSWQQPLILPIDYSSLTRSDVTPKRED